MYNATFTILLPLWSLGGWLVDKSGWYRFSAGRRISVPRSGCRHRVQPSGRIGRYRPQVLGVHDQSVYIPGFVYIELHTQCFITKPFVRNDQFPVEEQEMLSLFHLTVVIEVNGESLVVDLDRFSTSLFLFSNRASVTGFSPQPRV